MDVISMLEWVSPTRLVGQVTQDAEDSPSIPTTLHRTRSLEMECMDLNLCIQHVYF